MTIDEKTLDVRIEKVVKSSQLSKKSTKELINEIIPSPNLNSFFNQFPKLPIYKRLLFLHRFDLFGIEDEMQIPYLHLCIQPKIKKNIELGDSESTALQYLVSNELEIFNNYKNIWEPMLGIDVSNRDVILEDFKDIIAYFLIQFIRDNPKIMELANADQFDYNIMKSVLKSYKDTINLDTSLANIEKGFGKGETDPIIKSKVENLLLLLVSGLTKNIETFIENTPKVIPNIILSLHLTSSLWLRNLLTKSSLSFNDYLNILDGLYRYNLIKNKNTIFWCENCSIESPSLTQHSGKIAPSKISRSKCLNCGKPQSYGSIFSLNDTLKEAILSKDGLLSVYFGWLLQKEGIEYEVGGYSGKYENDFIIKKSILVECKIFKSQKDTVAIQSEIDGSLSQIKKHVGALNSEGTKIKEAYLLWNRYDDEEELQMKLLNRYNELFKEYGFKIICPDKIEDFVNDVKAN